jgi:hypothetical protein
MIDNSPRTFRLGAKRIERIKDAVERYELTSAEAFVRYACDMALERLCIDDLLSIR